MPQLPWTDQQSITLLQLVIQCGGHTCTKGTVTKIWVNIYESFRKADCIVPYAQEHFSNEKDGVRKLREKLKSLTQKAEKEMGWGDFRAGKTANLSKYCGDLAKVYQLIKQIEIEKDDDVEKKLLEAQEKENQKKKLEQVEKDALNINRGGQKPLKEKTLDGTPSFFS